jgi:hypothetical protein
MSEDPFAVIERFRRQRATFNCFGMGCGTTLLVLLATATAIWWLVRVAGE